MIYLPLETLVFDFSWVSKLTILLHNFGATTRCIFHPPNCVPIFPISPWYWKPSFCIFWGGRGWGDTTRCILAKCESGSCSRFLLWISVGKSNAEEKIKVYSFVLWDWNPCVDDEWTFCFSSEQMGIKLQMCTTDGIHATLLEM